MQGRRRINAKHIDLMLWVVVCSEENGCLFVIKASAPFNSDSENGNNNAQLHLELPVARRTKNSNLTQLKNMKNKNVIYKVPDNFFFIPSAMYHGVTTIKCPS